MKNILGRFFGDGFAGMVVGLFCTLVLGTILSYFGNIIGGVFGNYMCAAGNVSKTFTGAGIGVGMAARLRSSSLVTVSAAIAGMLGAYAGIDCIVIGNIGIPLGSFLAAYIAIEIGQLISAHTDFDILLVPLFSIVIGLAEGYFVAPYLNKFIMFIGMVMQNNINKNLIVGSMITSVLMCIIAVTPLCSLVVSLSVGLTGLAGGAAVIGCTCSMISFAVAGYPDNGVCGTLVNLFGTPMVQFTNILKKPILLIPSIIASAVLGPAATVILKMQCDAVGAGMGSSGFVGQLSVFRIMSENTNIFIVVIEIALMHFLLPGLIAAGLVAMMRKLGWIKRGDLRLGWWRQSSR